MQTSAELRNQKVHVLLAGLLSATQKQTKASYPDPFREEDVERLFSTHIWGHREILLTILLARMIEPTFKASKDFYACNPRSLYEKPIRGLLREYSIPHKKSGPLNVAKNSKKIDETWAYNKRGDGMALIVAKLVKQIESVSPPVLKQFALAYVKRYLEESVRVAKLTIKLQKIEDPVFLSLLCRDLVTEVPDGGATPQFIVGLILEAFNDGNGNSIETSGYLDSVSTTNTTSKKPGDIIEKLPDGSLRIYEVTVKEFSEDRLRESYESIKAFDHAGLIQEVFVICRDRDVPKTAERLDGFLGFIGATKHQDLLYLFVNIFEWIEHQLIFMPRENRAEFYADLVAHVNEFNSSEKVKRYFATWHDKNFHG